MYVDRSISAAIASSYTHLYLYLSIYTGIAVAIMAGAVLQKTIAWFVDSTVLWVKLDWVSIGLVWLGYDTPVPGLLTVVWFSLIRLG